MATQESANLLRDIDWSERDEEEYLRRKEHEAAVYCRVIDRSSNAASNWRGTGVSIDEFVDLCCDAIEAGNQAIEGQLNQAFLDSLVDEVCLARMVMLLRVYGGELFDGYARPSLPAAFVVRIRREILRRAKMTKTRAGDVAQYVNETLGLPENSGGVRRIAEGGWGLTVKTGVHLIKAAAAKGLLENADELIQEASELECIALTRKRWRRAKRPEILLEDILGPYPNEHSMELREAFKLEYLNTLRKGRMAKLYYHKLYFQTDLSIAQ